MNKSVEELFDTDELRPSEAVGAVRVTGLTLNREEEHGFPVFVLAAQHGLAIDLRDVEDFLPRWVRVHPHADPVHQALKAIALLASDHHVFKAEKIGPINAFLRQGINETSVYEKDLGDLRDLTG